MRIKKAMLFITVLCLMAGSLVACGGSGGSGTQASGEQASKKEITEADVLGRWVCPMTKDVMELKEGGLMEFTDFGRSIPSGSQTGVTVKDNAVIVRLIDSYDSDDKLEYDDSGEVVKLVGDKADFIREDDYYAGLERFSVGDKFSTDSAEAAISSLSFVSGEQLVAYFNKNDNTYVRNIDPDMSYAVIGFDLTNLSKQEFQTAKSISVTLDYNDGFKFSTVGDADCILREGNTFCAYHNNGSVGSNISGVTLSPLDDKPFELAIPCATKVAEDQNGKFVIFVTLPTENGVKEFAVNVE